MICIIVLARAHFNTQPSANFIKCTQLMIPLEFLPFNWARILSGHFQNYRANFIIIKPNFLEQQCNAEESE